MSTFELSLQLCFKRWDRSSSRTVGQVGPLKPRVAESDVHGVRLLPREFLPRGESELLVSANFHILWGFVDRSFVSGVGEVCGATVGEVRGATGHPAVS